MKPSALLARFIPPRATRTSELRILAVGVLLAVAALSSVGFFTDRVQHAVSQQATALLGADLVVVSSVAPREDLRRTARAAGLQVTETVNFPSVALYRDATLLTEVKAVNAGYPLRGELRLARQPLGKDFPAQGIPAQGEAWVEPRVLQQLGAAIGESIRLGERDFTVTRVVSVEPDRGGDLFHLAPRVLLNAADLPSTGLVSPASRVHYRLLLAGSPAAVAAVRDSLARQLEPGERLQDVRDARPELRTALDRARQFLGLAAVTAVLLAGAAISVATHHYAREQADACAVMRCLGASGRRILCGYAMRLLWLALGASLAGCLLGLLAQELLARLLAHWFVAATLPAASAWPVVAGLGVGLVTVAGFALPYLLSLIRVTPLRALRRDLKTPPPAARVVLLFALTTLAGLLLPIAGDLELAGWLLLGACATGLLLWLAGLVLIRALSTFSSRGRLAWRLGLAALARRGRLGGLQVAAFGLGIMALLILGMVRIDLLQAWQSNLPADVPNQFLINVRADEIEPIGALLRAGGVRLSGFYPMVRGRLVAIDDRPVRPEDFEDARARRLVEREFNLSWTSRPPGDNRIIAGRWWSGYGDGGLSLEQGLAKTLGIRLGDRLRFSIAGEEVSARVESLRRVDWDSFRVNFFVILPPGVLEHFPATYITSFYLPDDRGELLSRLVRRFPSAIVIDVHPILREVRAIMDRAALAIEYVIAFTLLAGLTVLYATVQATRAGRGQETAILRALGASRRQVLTSLFVEFATLGVLAGLVAAAGASAVGHALATRVFDLPLHIDPWVWLAGTFGGGLGVGLAGIMGTRTVLTQPPLETLRDVRAG
jgi:putative ABC transport system permease protein